MCVRYVLASGTRVIEKELLAEFREPFVPFYNAHPGGQWPVVLSEDPLALRTATWGLTPRWSRWANCHYNYNAFAADLVKHPVYKVPVRRTRCLVPSNCFFAWFQRSESIPTTAVAQPHVVYMEGQRIFTMAGLYDTWKSREGVVLYSFSIVTTYATRKIRDRLPIVPAVVPPSRRSRYLKADLPLNEVMSMFHSVESDRFRFYPVGDVANRAWINDKSAVMPVGGTF